MEFKHDVDSVAKVLARSISADVNEANDPITFTVTKPYTDERVSLVITKIELGNVVSCLSSMNISDELMLYNDRSLEVIVREESPMPGHSRILRNGSLAATDPESAIEYEISPASDVYLVWLLCLIEDHSSLRDIPFLSSSRIRADGILKEGNKPELFAFIKATSVRYLTLKIRSESALSLRRLIQATDALVFHVAYNMDIALVRLRFVEELSRPSRISRMRRSRTGELDPPRRLYKEDLVSHYVLAVSADSPTVQYLSYYHVLEHYFKAVFDDSLIEQVKSIITHPGFSYKRKKDVSQLINAVKNSIQVRSETVTFSEKEALRLTLIRYVHLSDLVSNIEAYETALLDYYRDVSVSFSDGQRVDLRSANNEDVITNLAKRIYSTRNALVHSKDGEGPRYVPFKDERALIAEIPLMRFIAEMVILHESQIA